MNIISAGHPFPWWEKSGLGVYSLLVGTELVDGLLHINFAGLQLSAGEVCTVGGVGEVLCLEAQARVLAEGGAMLALVTVSPVVAIELHTGFCGPALHGTACRGFYH